MNVAAVLPAAGQGRRLGGRTPKALVRLDGVPLLVRTLRALRGAYPFKEMLVAAGQQWAGAARRVLGRHGLSDVRVVPGGRSRAESVRNAVRALHGGAEWVLVHDAARPFPSRVLVRRLLKAAQASGAALCAVPVTDTVKQAARGSARVQRTLDRRLLWLAQTPQAFRRELLMRRYSEVGRRLALATDEAFLFEGTRVEVRLVPGEARNFKITSRGDLAAARFFLRKHGDANRNRL